MIEKLSRNLNQFYHFSLVFIMVATLGTIFYFWKLGFIDGSRNKDLHKVNYILEQIETKNPVNEIKATVYNENPKLAISKVESLESDLERINRMVEDKDFSEIKKESQDVKTAIANLISFPKTGKVISVFNDKLSKFNTYVENQKWRTLTRTSKRVLNLTTGHINRKELAGLIKTIEKDFSYMVKVTENSILPSPDKSEILSRISNLEVETNMMKKYLEERSFFYGVINTYKKNLDSWITKISPELSYQKIQVEQMGRYYIMGLFGILGLVSTIFFGSFFFAKWHRKKAQGELEKFMENFVTEGMVENKLQDLKDFSKGFQNYSSQTAEYIDKRMSYGSIFQEALPLSSIMLDKNLKVVWANRQFCDDWELSEDEINKDYLSWDYLSKLTNIGDNDPILEALKHHVAGIYQVQIKVNEDSDVKPYEMFVSPVKYNNQTKIMLFFYPLMSLQETIRDQARSIVNPIEKTLSLISQGEFTTQNKEILEKEYAIGDIKPVLGLFEKLVSEFEEEKSHLFNQIELLYGKLDKYADLSDETEKANFGIAESNKGQISDLKAFKTNVIDLSMYGKQSETLSQHELSTISNLLKSFNSNFTKVTSLKDIVEEMSISMPKFATVKEDIKAQKNLLSDTKMRLAHSLAQMIHVKKKITDPEIVERFANSYDRVNSEFEKLDLISTDLEKKITNLEVLLSKGQMIVNDINLKMDKFDTKDEQRTLLQGQEEFKDFLKRSDSIKGKISTIEDEVVRNLKSLYIHTKTNLEYSRDIAGAMQERPSLIESNDKEDEQHQNFNKPLEEQSGINS